MWRYVVKSVMLAGPSLYNACAFRNAVCLTSKISRAYAWRRACVSTICDKYRRWLHRFVRRVGIYKSIVRLHSGMVWWFGNSFLAFRLRRRHLRGLIAKGRLFRGVGQGTLRKPFFKAAHPQNETKTRRSHFWRCDVARGIAEGCVCTPNKWPFSKR